ncbi:MAG TPA: SAF domain-containing protein [Planktothrix sp.]
MMRMVNVPLFLALANCVALLLGPVCSVLVAQKLTSAEIEASAAQARIGLSNEKGPVVYAVHDIPAGSIIKAADIRTELILVSQYPQGSIHDELVAIGRKTNSGMNKYEIVNVSDIGADGWKQ